MGIHILYLYKEEDKKYIGRNLKTTELLDCALIGVCAVIRNGYGTKNIYLDTPLSGNLLGLCCHRFSKYHMYVLEPH